MSKKEIEHVLTKRNKRFLGFVVYQPFDLQTSAGADGAASESVLSINDLGLFAVHMKILIQ